MICETEGFFEMRPTLTVMLAAALLTSSALAGSDPLGAAAISAGGRSRESPDRYLQPAAEAGKTFNSSISKTSV